MSAFFGGMGFGGFLVTLILNTSMTSHVALSIPILPALTACYAASITATVIAVAWALNRDA